MRIATTLTDDGRSAADALEVVALTEICAGSVGLPTEL